MVAGCHGEDQKQRRWEQAAKQMERGSCVGSQPDSGVVAGS